MQHYINGNCMQQMYLSTETTIDAYSRIKIGFDRKKNVNSFETFISITLWGSFYKINQDPCREKSGRHFWGPYSIWPPPKITNNHNFGIIKPRKVILVSNPMFGGMIYSLMHVKCSQILHDLKSNMAATLNVQNKKKTSITLVLSSLRRWSWCIIPCFVWSIHLCM